VIRNYVFVQHGIRAVKLKQMSVGVFLHIDTGIILFTGSDAIQANLCLVFAETNGCQVRDWIVRKLGIKISNFIQHGCV